MWVSEIMQRRVLTDSGDMLCRTLGRSEAKTHQHALVLLLGVQLYETARTLSMVQSKSFHGIKKPDLKIRTNHRLI